MRDISMNGKMIVFKSEKVVYTTFEDYKSRPLKDFYSKSSKRYEFTSGEDIIFIDSLAENKNMYIDRGSLYILGFCQMRDIKLGKGDIHVVGSLEVRNISCIGGDIQVSGGIEAEKIEAKSVFSYLWRLNCNKLATSQVPFWRDYYGKLPIFAGCYRDSIIENINMCFLDIRKYFRRLQINDPEEFVKIVNWDGFHPIIREQVRMFLGVKKSSTEFKNKITPYKWRNKWLVK